MNASIEQLQARIAELTAKNEALKAASVRGGKLTVKTAETGSGAVSVYGLGRFPVSLHPESWQKLAAFIPTVIAHVEAGLADGTLMTKADKVLAKATAPSAPATA